MKGKIALVVGATNGIGYAVAEKLAEKGAKVIITSRKTENVENAVQQLKSVGLNVEGVVSHIAHPEGRKTMFEEARKFCKLDILIICAGVNPAVVPILDTPENAWDKIMDVNLKSAFMATKEALPLLRKSKAGRIIYLSTVGGFSHLVHLGAYTVSKIGLFGLTKMVALQLAKENITVNCVSPGVIVTSFSRVLLAEEEEKEKTLAKIPLGRFGTTQEVANVIAFIASDESSYITGENICVGGGLASRL